MEPATPSRRDPEAEAEAIRKLAILLRPIVFDGAPMPAWMRSDEEAELHRRQPPRPFRR